MHSIEVELILDSYVKMSLDFFVFIWSELPTSLSVSILYSNLKPDCKL